MTEKMSNLDFLYEIADDFEIENRRVDENGNINVDVTFYGEEDLSWFEYKMIFDKDGNFISREEGEHYY